MSKKISEVATRAIKCMETAIEAESDNRSAMLEDLQFSNGDQWSAEVKMQRQLDRRPCLTINKTDTFVRSVVNNMRQQRPRIKVHPVSDGADVQTAEVIEGLMRHIEVNSHAESAYDTAAEYQTRMGLGFMRVAARYIDDKSFDQELYIDRVRNPFSVYFDPSSTAPDGLDAEWCVVVDRIRKDEFKKKYPWAEDQDFQMSGPGDSRESWSTKEETLIAEFWRVEFQKDTLIKLSSGETVFASDTDGAKEIGDMVGNTMVIDKRDSMKRTVKWSKVTKTQELESREWPGKYIPIVPVYGSEILDDGKILRYGMVRNLRDPQRMYNYWRSSETEFAGVAPKAPWLVAEGQIENHEDEWSTANIKNHATLTYKPVQDDNGQTLPPPMRLQPQSIPAASVNAAMSASEDLKAVAGMFDPSLGAPGNETSGTMVAQRQQQSDQSNYHFYDNLTKSIRGVGIILLDLLPHYYNEERAIRIIGADGNPDIAYINKPQVDKILNDVCTGRYDVIMETGPGYSTKRQEATASMLQLAHAIPEVMKDAADLIVSQMDFPMAQELAERLRIANPLAQQQAQIPKDIDPKAQQMIGNLMGQLHQAQQQLQQLQQEKQAKVIGMQEKAELELKRQVERELAETHRLHIREDGEMKRAKLAASTKLHDVASRDSTTMHAVMIETAAELATHRDISNTREQPNIG